MPYTLWSRGRLLGETELEYVRCIPLHRAGGFWPNVAGSKLLTATTDVRAASLRLGRRTRNLARPDGSRPEPGHEFEAAVHELTEYADYIDASNRAGALELELRDAQGNIVPTEDIDIRDTRFDQDLAERDAELGFGDHMEIEDYDPELEAAIQHDLIALGLEPDPLDAAPFDPEPTTDPTFAHPPFPVYQIHVRLLDEAAIP